MAKSKTKSMPLSEPVTITIGDREEEITELVFRKPKGKDFRARDKASGDVDATIRIIASLTSQTVQVIDELDGEDFIRASEIVAGFMKASPETAKT